MIFGSRYFGIEVGELTTEAGSGTTLVQFRFLVKDREIGDWEDRIRLRDSLHYSRVFLDCKGQRMRTDLANANSDDVFKNLYDAFFDYDYSSAPLQKPNLRDKFHLDDVGLGAISDRYGLVIVDISDKESRIIVKKFSGSEFVADQKIPSDEVNKVFQDYLNWGESKVEHVI